MCDAPCAVGYGGPVQETRWRKSVLSAFGKRAIKTYESLGVINGPMFRLASLGRGAKVKQCAMGDLNPAFHALLK